MMRKRIILHVSVVLLIPAIAVIGFPSLTPHPHDSNNVKWENDPVKDGSSAHNHVWADDFGGFEEALRDYNALSCWDNEFYVLDTSGKFDYGHCFINEFGFPFSSTVNYQFTTSAGVAWNNDAKNRVRDAFDEWNEVFTLLPTGLATGIKFEEGTPADIEVRMKSIGPIGQWDPFTQLLEFDSSGRNYSYQKSKSGVPTNQEHFYSVALHEVGHVVGLGHRLGNDLMYPGIGSAVIGGPLVDNGIHWDDISAGAYKGAVELYSQTVAMPAPPSANVELLFCIGWNAHYYADWDGHVAHAGDSFEVQYQNEWGSWLPGYTGTGGATEVSNKFGHINMRVKIICIGGTTVWVNFGTNEGCMNGPPV